MYFIGAVGSSLKFEYFPKGEKTGKCTFLAKKKASKTEKPRNPKETLRLSDTVSGPKPRICMHVLIYLILNRK